MRVVLFSVLGLLSALLCLFLVLYFTLAGGPVEQRLKLNATCKHENLTGICKNKDSCLSNLTAIKLEPCNEGDLSLVCCPHEEMAIPNSLLQTDKNVISNRPKRTPGEKAKEMCQIYGETAYHSIKNPSSIGPPFIKVPLCDTQEPLIKGGQDAKEKEFPHMVEIAKFISTGLGGLEGICSGSIVSPEFVLGAAHCSVSKDDGFVVFGTNKKITGETMQFNKFAESHITSISDVFIHPHYNAANNNNDIALFKLSTKLSKTERPICLDTGSSIFNNMMVIATGFGLNKEQKSSDVLQKAELKIVDQASCATKYKKYSRILPENPVCAYVEGKDTCDGDYEVTIQIHHKLECMYTLIGIPSFGPKCTQDSNVPGIYTKVSAYIGWIEDIVWPA